MTIEQALAWAYRQELPKATVVASNDGIGASSWSAVSRYGELLASIDHSPVNQWGCVIDFSGSRGPHPDALAIGDAVIALDACEFGLPDCWSPVEDLGELGSLGALAVASGLESLTRKDDDGRVWLRTPPSRIVRKHAVLGGVPDWGMERPVERVVTGANGKPRWFRRVLIENRAAGGWLEIEGDGWNEKRKRPYADAYQKRVLDPDPAPGVVARGEYEIWRAALDLLVDDLEGAIGSFALARSTAPARPWLGDTRVPPRILWAKARQQPRIETSAIGRRKRAARLS